MCKKHEEPGLGRNNPYFPGLREAIFHGRFPSEIPKVGFFLSPFSGNLGNLGGVKSPHLCVCHFRPFDALTGWQWVSDGIKNGQQDGLNRAAREEIGAYVTKIGQKRRDGTFHHNWTATQQAQRCPASRSGGEIKPLWEFFAHTSLLLCIITDMHLAHCICIVFASYLQCI